MPEVTRFAPSPTGRLHLGHVYSALFAARLGGMLLRIEDIDHTRCREEFVKTIIDDLALLGFSFTNPMRQSKRMAAYTAALKQLQTAGLVYPCFCTRSELALAADHVRPRAYSGRCKKLSAVERKARIARGDPFALRLDTAAAHEQAGELGFTDHCVGAMPVDYAVIGDPVIARKELAVSYHLACVVDDAAQGVTLVTRGNDLLEACHIQRLLQALLGLPEPRYCHHPLLLGADGKRLAKRRGVASFGELAAGGVLSLERLHQDFESWFAGLNCASVMQCACSHKERPQA